MCCHEAYLSTPPTVSRIIVLVVELRRTTLDPLDKLLNLFMFKQPLKRVVVVLQLTFTERSVNLLMAHLVHRRSNFPTERLGD